SSARLYDRRHRRLRPARFRPPLSAGADDHLHQWRLQEPFARPGGDAGARDRPPRRPARPLRYVPRPLGGPSAVCAGAEAARPRRALAGAREGRKVGVGRVTARAILRNGISFRGPRMMFRRFTFSLVLLATAAAAQGLPPLIDRDLLFGNP